MFISIKPNQATAYQSSDGPQLLIMSGESQDDAGTLEIGKDHVFASKKHLGLLSKKRNIGLKVRIQRKNSLNDLAVTKLNLSAGKIGELVFCPPIKGDGLSVGTHASVEADVFVDDQFFENLLNALLANRELESVQLYLNEDEALSYGWEPNGSRKIWKVQNPSEISTVGIGRISLSYQLIS